IDGSRVPVELTPFGILVFSERLRPDAAETIRYLLSQGITVKVISGDDPQTVSSVAERVGVPLLGEPFDARHLPDDPAMLAELAENTSVFGRVRPSQKRELVEALQARGH